MTADEVFRENMFVDEEHQILSFKVECSIYQLDLLILPFISN